MTVNNHTTPCADIFGLLQPFVDNELTDGERTIVIEHLESCHDCLAQIQMQQRVRAALKQLSLEPAPVSLRTTILAELDRIDASGDLTSSAADPNHLTMATLWQHWRQRLQAFVRGGLVMLPASVAAIGLFFGIQYSFETNQKISPESLTGSVQQTLPLPGKPSLGTNRNPSSSLPPDVELISTSPKSRSYRHHGLGLRVVDHHERPPIQDTASNLHHVGNQSYRLSRDARGWPVIQFRSNHVLHTLVFENAPDRRLVGSMGGVSAPDFQHLLDLANALADDSAPTTQD